MQNSPYSVPGTEYGGVGVSRLPILPRFGARHRLVHHGLQIGHNMPQTAGLDVHLLGCHGALLRARRGPVCDLFNLPDRRTNPRHRRMLRSATVANLIHEAADLGV